MDNKALAKAFAAAIQTIANKPEQLENMEKYANSPEKLVSELRDFANMRF